MSDPIKEVIQVLVISWNIRSTGAFNFPPHKPHQVERLQLQKIDSMPQTQQPQMRAKKGSSGLNHPKYQHQHPASQKKEKNEPVAIVPLTVTRNLSGVAEAISESSRESYQVARGLDHLWAGLREGNLKVGGNPVRVEGAGSIIEFKHHGSGARLFARRVNTFEYEAVGECSHGTWQHDSMIKEVVRLYGDKHKK